MSAFKFSLMVWLAALASPLAAESIAIVNGHVVSAAPKRELARATVLIENGHIVAVGADITVPRRARVIDADGKVVTAGLVAADTTLGATEINEGARADDDSTDSAHLSAAYDIQYALNPQSTLLPIARLGGVTRAIVTPTVKGDKGREVLFAGQAAIIHLGQTQNILVKPHAGVVLDMGSAGATNIGGGRGASMVVLRAIMADVRLYAANRAAYDKGELRQMELSGPDLEALAPVVAGREPLVVRVDRASDIVAMLQFAKAEKVRLILAGAAEGWMVAEQIAAAKVPVVLDANSSLPLTFDRLNASLENPARLNAAGVTIVIRGEGDGHFARNLRYNAGIAVAHGLPYPAALAAITVNPARVWGETHWGTLAPGQEADVVVWSGDPFEPLTQPEAVFIRGVQQSLTSRHTELRDRYLKPIPAPAAQ